MAWSSYVVSSALIKFGQRLARLSMALGRVGRDGHVLLESLALFIRYVLMVQASLAEGDDVARPVGRDRFDAFIARVGEALASGQRTIASSVTKSTRSEEHTSELPSLMRTSYAVFCLNKPTYMSLQRPKANVCPTDT